MFGPPGLLARAATGEFGDSVCPDYGLCPRGLLNIFSQLPALQQQGLRYTLTASAVELTVSDGGQSGHVCQGGRSRYITVAPERTAASVGEWPSHTVVINL
jgi:hypothetical protein